MKMITNEQIASDRKLCEEATQEPWQLSKESPKIIKDLFDQELIGSAAGYTGSWAFPSDEQAIINARIMVRARNALPKYIEALEESQAECERLRAALENIANTVVYSEDQLSICDDYQLLQMSAEAFHATQSLAQEALKPKETK